jgi:hypothetical protein
MQELEERAMDLSSLNYEIETDDGPQLIARPGLSICMIYAQPADEIGPYVARILDAYLKFIPQGALETYLAGNGNWKTLTPRVLKATFDNLNDVGKGLYSEFHFGQEPAGNVGEYGANFKAGPLNDPFFDREANILHLEFPLDYAEPENAERLAGFFLEAVRILPPDSGYCGYAFKHLFMTFIEDALDYIGTKAMRFVGFDIPEDLIRSEARGRVYNISWLTVLGPAIVQELGGMDTLRTNLGGDLSMQEVASTAVIRAAELPIVGDVNRGAKDAKPLKRLAEITKPVRLEIELTIGPEELDLATRWPARFDELDV